MDDARLIITRPICKSIISAFLKMLEATPMQKRLRAPSLSVGGKNNYFDDLHHPPYVNAEIVAENDLKACESLGIIHIKYGDKKTYLPFAKRKISIAFNPEHEALCRVTLGKELSTVHKEWNEAISVSSLSRNIKEALGRTQPISIGGRSAYDILRRLEIYLAKRRSGDFVRIASASMFWGLSKVLDNRPELWEILNLTSSPVRLNAWAPNKSTSKILFIENMQTFEAAQLNTDRFGDFILVYSSGFAGTANRLNSPSGRSIYFSANGEYSDGHLETLNSCLDGNTGVESYFWGDLDYSGIDIYLALKKLIPSVTLWKEGYLAMVRESKESGHTPSQSKKEGQIEPMRTGIDFIDEILVPSMKANGFFDQEGILF